MATASEITNNISGDGGSGGGAEIALTGQPDEETAIQQAAEVLTILNTTITTNRDDLTKSVQAAVTNTGDVPPEASAILIQSILNNSPQSKKVLMAMLDESKTTTFDFQPQGFPLMKFTTKYEVDDHGVGKLRAKIESTAMVPNFAAAPKLATKVDGFHHIEETTTLTIWGKGGENEQIVTFAPPADPEKQQLIASEKVMDKLKDVAVQNTVKKIETIKKASEKQIEDAISGRDGVVAKIDNLKIKIKDGNVKDINRSIDEINSLVNAKEDPPTEEKEGSKVTNSPSHKKSRKGIKDALKDNTNGQDNGEQGGTRKRNNRYSNNEYPDTNHQRGGHSNQRKQQSFGTNHYQQHNTSSYYENPQHGNQPWKQAQQNPMPPQQQQHHQSHHPRQPIQDDVVSVDRTGIINPSKQQPGMNWKFVDLQGHAEPVYCRDNYISNPGRLYQLLNRNGNTPIQVHISAMTFADGRDTKGGGRPAIRKMTILS